MSRILFVFLDGFGLAPPGPDNPLSQYAWPGLCALLGARPLLGEEVREQQRLMVPLDCGLGVEGLPQSATGQVALLCGVNAPAMLGFHAAAYPNAQLRRVIEHDNVLKHVTLAGRDATFANAYTPEYFEAVKARKLRHSATTLCVYSAGLPFRMVDEMLRGEAVTWDVTRAHLRERSGYEQMPLVTPWEAGASLAGLTRSRELVLFECFVSDRIGHAQDVAAAVEFARLVDGLLSACAAGLPEDGTLVVCADHGNIEDLSIRTHTRNAVPLIVLGPAAGQFASLHDITEIAPAIYRALGVE